MKCADHPKRNAVMIYDWNFKGKYFCGACDECWKELKKDVKKYNEINMSSN